MDDTRCRQFFLEPAETYHRQYEALRTFFVEGRQLREIAQQFGYQESSLRVMVSQFRNQVKVNDLPPFLFSRSSGGRRGSPVSKRRYVQKRQRSLTAAP
jgi:transposase-like protein